MKRLKIYKWNTKKDFWLCEVWFNWNQLLLGWWIDNTKWYCNIQIHIFFLQIEFIIQKNSHDKSLDKKTTKSAH